MLIMDLRWLLLLLFVLPLLAVVATLLFTHWIEQKNKFSELLTTLSPLLSNAPIGLFIIKQEQKHQQKIVYANSYAKNLFGSATSQHKMPHELSGLWEEGIANNIASGEGTKKILGKYHSLESDIAPTASSQKRRLRWWITDWDKYRLIFFTDVTPQQQNVQRFSLMLGRLGHELRTPIETITAHLEVLGLPQISEEQKQQSLAYAKAETQRLSRLSNRTLELVRLENRLYTETELLDLTALSKEVVRELSNKAEEKSITLRTQVDSSLPEVLGNRELLKQVQINLIGNSIAHCREDDVVTVLLSKEMNGVACAICDTGPGIAPTHLPHLTQPFYRAGATNVSGMGLGLAIVSEILHQHQSHLMIESIYKDTAASDEDSGTVMRFVLPTLSESSHDNQQ